MMFAILLELADHFDWATLAAACLWAGLVALSLGLSFLLWTRWGFYHLTGKCILFSLLAHALVGLFFATADVVEDVVVALNSPSDQLPITIDEVRVVNQADDEPAATVDGRGDDGIASSFDRPAHAIAIESASLANQRPVTPDPPPVERSLSAETDQLPADTPKPNVAVATPPEPTPQSLRPGTEAMQLEETLGAPAEPLAQSDNAKPETLPESTSNAAPPSFDSPIVRRSSPTTTDHDDKQPRPQELAATPVPVGGTVPDTPAKPIASAIRTGTAPSRSDRATAPIRTPDMVRRDGPASAATAAGGSGTVPSTTVRIGVPSGAGTGGFDAVPKRPASASGDSDAIPRPKPPAPSGIASNTRGGGADTDAAAVPVRTGNAPMSGSHSAYRAGNRLGTPEIYRDRMSPNRSEQAVKRGGSKASEEAVERALEWLAAHQHPDGHWDVDGFQRLCPAGNVCSSTGSQNRDDCAVTGLVLLAFLGAGNTHWDGKYSTHVLNGLNWLIAQMKPNGDVRGSGRMYSQGIATLALSEAFGMSGDPKLRDPVERAVQFIVDAQHPSSGGWRYLPGQYGDTSIYGWQVMALKSASLAGVEVPEITWRRARTWLTIVGSGKHGGLASYQPGEPPTPPMTAEALACRVFLGDARPSSPRGSEPPDEVPFSPESSPTLREAADYLMQYPPQWNRLNLYYWYYGTIASYQMGGEYWERWNASLRDTLIEHQVRQGHAAGSWDPNPMLDTWGKEGGRVYSTALATLCLEVYYRFLPIQSLTSAPAAETPRAAGGAPTGRPATSK